MDPDTKKILKKIYKTQKNANISNLGIKGNIILSRYQCLEILDCSNNSITEITSIVSLPNFHTLDCSNNLIKKLNCYIFTYELSVLEIFGNPIEKLEIYTSTKISKYPDTLTDLTLWNMPKNFSAKIFDAGIYPDTITTLTFAGGFNIPIINYPPNVQVLNLVCDYNQPLTVLPKKIQSLKLGDAFTYPLNTIPNTVTELKFGVKFHDTLEFLPNSIKKLSIGYGYDSSLDDLPPNITYLQLCCDIQSLDKLPVGLVELHVVRYNFNSLINNLPASLESLFLNHYFN